MKYLHESWGSFGVPEASALLVNWSGLTVAAVRHLASPRVLRSAVEEEDFEQEIVDQYALALAAPGAGDSTVGFHCHTAVDFVRHDPAPSRTMTS